MFIFSNKILVLTVICVVLSFTYSLPSQAQVSEAIELPVGVKGKEKIHKIVPGSGQSFRDVDYAPEMVVIPAGKFMMGSPKSEEGRDGNEGPQREVTIGKAFAVGKYEVTFAQWDACVAAGSCNDYRPDDEGWGRGQRPVINVSWDDAKAYVKWLSKETGQTYRLLTEAEWEYVARSGTETRYSYGNIEADLCVYGNGADDSSSRRDRNEECDDGVSDKTAPVGSYKQNKFGLYDIHGNVAELVEDVYHENYKGAPKDGSAWVSGNDQSLRVARGGCWSDAAVFLRSAYRDTSFTHSRDIITGFRIARSIFTR